MTVRREVIKAIGGLTPDQRAQLLLYLMGDDWAALEVIDRHRWAYQEFVPYKPGFVGPVPAEAATDRNEASSGEQLT